MRSQWVSFLLFCACYAVQSFCLLIGQQVRESNTLYLAFAARLGYLALALTMGLLLWQAGRDSRWGQKTSNVLAAVFSDAIAFAVFVGFICSVVSNLQCLPGSEFWNVFEAFFFVMVLMHLCRLHLQGFFPVVLCVLVISVMAVILAVKQEEELLLECIIYSVLFAGTQLIASQGDPRGAWANHKAMCEEHERVSQLLDSMLPREVLQEMKSGKLRTAYNYEDMTLLFADIVGFTHYCSVNQPEQAVDLVTKLFAEFDEQAKNLGIYKVCTIGDAYVVVNEPCMNPDRASQDRASQDKFGDEHVQRDCMSVFSMSKWMLQTIVRIREEVNHHDLDMRIGLHFGRFVGGVIGTRRVRFDIWGPDVLIGNNVEANGKGGHICVSEEAKGMLETCGVGQQLQFTYNQNIELKNGRVVRTYICTPERGLSFAEERREAMEADLSPPKQ